MTSPVVRPAWAAGPPETTLLTVAPPLLDPLEPLPELPPKKPPVPLCPLLLARGQSHAEEGCGADVGRGRPLTRLDLLDDGEGVIDRNGIALGARGLQAETLGGGGVDANHFPGGVDQGSPGISRLDVGIRLDEIRELFARPIEVVACCDRLVEGR